jgi:hypothetical protein
MTKTRLVTILGGLFLTALMQAGCGGSAGPACTPKCTGKPCGSSNGCGGLCGVSDAGSCDVDMNTCTAQCNGKVCGDDGCGGSCGDCPTGTTCQADGTCMCVPECGGKTCGPDGCGGMCGNCTAGFMCNGTGGCDIDPAHTWVLKFTNGTVSATNSSGGSWDSFGGAPDPMVCISLPGGQGHCNNGSYTSTGYANDTQTPVWNFAFTPQTANKLLNGVNVQYEDYDPIGSNDVICGDTLVPITLDNFKAGTWSGGCALGHWNATLTPQ